MTEVGVLGVGAFVAGHGGLGAWCDDTADGPGAPGAPDEPADAPSASLIPARQRRRASLLSRAMADAYRDALEGAGLEAASVASVFGSALGEASTMIGLLDQMWDAESALSPMKFATSVHNAASGAISIATKNRGYTTSIGADYDTPAMALLEGVAWAVTHEECVIVCCGDEAPPADLVPRGLGWGLLAVAIALGPVPSTGPGPLARITAPVIEPATVEPTARDEQLERNPCIGLLDLAQAIATGRAGVVGLDRGPGRGYSTRLAKAG